MFSTIRGRHVAARNERRIQRAINAVHSPKMRDELIVLHERYLNGLGR